MKRIAMGMLLLLGAIELPLACSTKVPLAQINKLCEYDEQCANGLACRCVRRRNPDDEGPDEILAPGICQTREHRCAGDAGITDTAVTDAVTETGTDTGAVTDAAADAADGD
jgi:hypothetical protein